MMASHNLNEGNTENQILSLRLRGAVNYKIQFLTQISLQCAVTTLALAKAQWVCEVFEK